MPELIEEHVEEYFRDARERHAVYLRRTAGRQKPWTEDAIMQNYRITNVFRELDKTTVHLRTHVRDPLKDHFLVLPATVLYRWFTLIKSAETIFLQPSFLLEPVSTSSGPAGGQSKPPDPALAARYAPAAGLPAALAAPSAGAPATPWQRWLQTEDVRELEWALRKQGSPWVTGSFMIRSPIGMDKLEGVLSSFRSFWNGRPKFKLRDGRYVSMGWADVAEYVADARAIGDSVPLADIHEWLTHFYGLGGFLANEIVSDLRHTFMGDTAPDEGTFNFPGPGAMRGAYLMLYGVKQGRKDRLEKASVKDVEFVSTRLRELSRDVRFWPQPDTDSEDFSYSMHESYDDQNLREFNRIGNWPSWGGREPGMWLCEYTKIKRTRLGIGRPRGNYE